MHRCFRLLLAATLALGALSPAMARPPVPVAHPAPSGRIKFDLHKFIPATELKPGMKGYALSVFKGTKIEKFGVEILGVLDKANNGQDWILFRATSGTPVTRGLNIASGMSGSPVYINGRLAGAIAASIPFSKDPVGLITPIQDMFDAWSPDLPAKPSSMSATAATDSSSGATNRFSFGGGFGVRSESFQPLDIPIAVSGVSSQGVRRLQDALAPLHVNVVAGGGMGVLGESEAIQARGAKLVPGAAVGVSLVQGDMDFTATGTVTYRDGNRILIFGHPFFGLGPIDAALTTAYVVDVNPSYQNSIKLGAPIKTVGRIFQDRPYSVGGLIGSMPQMVPVTVSVNDESIKRRKNFSFRVINHPLLTTQLVTQMAGQAIAQVHGLPGDTIASVTLDADVEEIGHVHRSNTFYDAVSIDQSAVGDLDTLLHLLSSNPFYPLALRSLKMGVTIQNRHDTAEIDHIFLKQGKYQPGDTVNVGVVLKPYKREPITRMMAVKIPSNVQPGMLTLNVKGGGSDSGGGLSLGGGLILLRPSDPGSPAGNVKQLVKQFVEKPHNDELVARLILPTSAININGEKLTSLPPTLSSVMQSSRSSGLKTERDEVKVIQGTPYIVSGAQSLTVTVEKKNVSETPAPGTSAPATSTPTPLPDTSSPDGLPADDTSDMSTDAALTDLQTTPAASILPGFSSAGPVVMVSASAPATSAKADAPSVATATTGATTSPASAKETPLKTVGRLASVWRQGTTADFSGGTQTNVSVSSAGDVRLSAALQKIGESGETYLWSLLPDGQGNVYAGTGDHGRVIKFDAAGKSSVFFDSDELEVTTLARDAAGNIYAGTAPHGIVYKIGADGKGKPFFTAPEKYVTALAWDEARSRLYVAVGGGTGRVYAVAASGGTMTDARPWFSSPETHLLALALDKSGNVYAGASPDGIIYKITPEGDGHVFYDAPDQSISSLAVDASGTVYAGTLGKGKIYKISPEGYGKVLSDRATAGVLSLRTDKDGNLYACSGNTVYCISPDETVQSFVAASDEQFLSLGTSDDSGQVYAGTGTVGSLYGISASGDLKGQFVSTVHDAGLSAHWGTISWIADTPPGTQVTLQTRSGDVPRPDDSWSAWSPAYATEAGHVITSPPARYLQYQATLTGTSAAVSQGNAPRLRAVTAYYLPRNQAPTVKMVSPAEGDAVSKAATLRWTASDPDKDTLTYDLSYSSDGGQTWTPIKKKAAPQTVTPTVPTKTTAPKAPTVTDREVAAGVKDMESHLPAGMPASVRQQIIAQAPTMVRQALMAQRGLTTGTGSASDTAAASGLKDMSYAWDTTSVKDGTYQIEIVASDKTSNPQNALTAKDTSPSFVVANTPPALTAGTPTVGLDKAITIRGSVSTPLAFVKAVQGRVDTGDPVAAVADDGLFDSTLENFTLILPSVASGAHTVEVQTVDQAGNTATKKVSVTVP